MIGKFLSQLLGGGGGGESEDRGDELLEFEEGGWVIVNLPEAGPLLSPGGSAPLENLLLEHPSMSVYQMRHAADHENDEEEEEEESSSEDEENRFSRPAASSLSLRRGRVSWRLAAWGVPLPLDALSLASGRGAVAAAAAERKKLSRGALLRQNLSTVKLRERRVFAHVKQPGPRPYNY
ncbi:uncharacterized protein LOC144018111 [Festucalex cinctus]